MLIFLLKLSMFWPLGNLSVGYCVVWTYLQYVVFGAFPYFHTFRHCKMPQCHLVYFLPQSLKQSFFQRALFPFLENGIKNQGQSAELALCSCVSFPPGSLRPFPHLC